MVLGIDLQAYKKLEFKSAEQVAAEQATEKVAAQAVMQKKLLM
jgi:hypothetical protein